MTARKSRLLRTKDLFKGLRLSTGLIVVAVICVIGAPIGDAYLQIEHASLKLEWFEVSFGWGIALLGIIVRLADRWNGAIRK